MISKIYLQTTNEISIISDCRRYSNIMRVFHFLCKP